MSDALKLYVVSIEHEVYAVGKDELDAIDNAKEGIREELLDGVEFAKEIRFAITKKWIDKTELASIPFGSEDERTLEQWIDALPQPLKKETL